MPCLPTQPLANKLTRPRAAVEMAPRSRECFIGCFHGCAQGGCETHGFGKQSGEAAKSQMLREMDTICMVAASSTTETVWITSGDCLLASLEDCVISPNIRCKSNRRVVVSREAWHGMTSLSTKKLCVSPLIQRPAMHANRL